MKPATIAKVALIAAVALVATIVLTGGSDGYELKLRMANAGGIKNGSPVTIGGVRIGTVYLDVDTRSQQAVATLKIKDKYQPIGKDTRAAIVAQNVLGQKQVQLTQGSATAQPAPSGFVVPADHITQGTDLDRVLSVLDADTRTRLAIFLNEAGTAFTGRKEDFRKALRTLGPAIGSANEVLRQLADDNASLERIVQTGDRYVAEVARRKDDVTRLVDRVGQAAVTGSTKRAQLRATLAAAPGALTTLRSFLGELQAATKPLGPAARQLSAASAPLRSTLDQVSPFTDAAAPALRTATSVAPTLERLAARATPVLRKAAPTVSALRTTVGTDLPPNLATTDRSIDNVLAVIENWSAAIQFRDNASHIFRGEASIAPDALQSVINRIAAKTQGTGKRGKHSGATAKESAPPAAAPEAKTPPELPKTLKLPGLAPIPVPQLGQTLTDVLGTLTGRLKQGLGRQQPGSGRDATTLLDFLLGK